MRSLIVLLALLVPCAPAVADDPVFVPAEQAPPAVARFVPLARAVWPNSPCADPQIAIAPSIANPDGGPSMAAGEAYPDECRILISSDQLTGDDDYLCMVVLHEWGHLALGLHAFPDNPSDPAHSPDPTSIMHSDLGLVRYAPCAAFLGGAVLRGEAEWYLVDNALIRDFNNVVCRSGSFATEVICRAGNNRVRVVASLQGWKVTHLMRYNGAHVARLRRLDHSRHHRPRRSARRLRRT